MNLIQKSKKRILSLLYLYTFRLLFFDIQMSILNKQINNYGFATGIGNNEQFSFPTNRIFMGNLASELEEFTIYRYCSAYGEIIKCQIMKEAKNDQRSRGFGFITYAQATSAQAILNARPHYIGHCKINIKPAFPTSETLIQGNAAHSTSNLPRTRRLFVAYSTEEAKINNLAEPAIFGFLSAYGVVKEIVQQFSSTTDNEDKKNTMNNYWIVEFLDESAIDHCMSKGAIQYFSGVRLYLKRVLSEQEVIRRKRKLHEDELKANKQAETERKFPFMSSLTR